MSSKDRVSAIIKGGQLLKEAAGLGTFSLSELASATGWSSSTTERYLNSFIDVGFVEREGNIYCIGLQMARFWASYRERQMKAIAEAGRNLKATEIND